MRKMMLLKPCCFLALLLCTQIIIAAPTCRSITSCSAPLATPSSSGCNIIIEWEQCDGTNGYKNSACRNTGCISDCVCSCDATGYHICWYDSCTQSIKSTDFTCAGCS